MQDPGTGLTALGTELPSALDPSARTVLDASHRSFVNHETIFFATEVEKRRFDADPIRGCGTSTEPVTRRRFVPGSDPIRVDHDGRPQYFPGPSAADNFRRDPEPFALPHRPRIDDDERES